MQSLDRWDPVEVPGHRDSRLDAGLVMTGVAYKTYRPQQLWFFIDVMIALKGLEEPGPSEVVPDPWRFRDLVDRVPIEAAYAQGNALLHLVHPETFEDCVSRDHMAQTSAAFGHGAETDQDDVDRALLQIRNALEGEAGHPINFYAEPYRSQWARERIRAWSMLELAREAIDRDHGVVGIDQLCDGVIECIYIGDSVGARGARLSIAATLLMGVDPTRYVPWRAQAIAAYEQLLGTELEQGGSDAAHYASYLEMRDLEERPDLAEWRDRGC